MSMSPQKLRLIVQDELIREGVFDGSLGAGRPVPPTAKEKSQTQERERQNSNQLANSGSKKLVPAVKAASKQLKDVPMADVKSMVTNITKPKEQAKEQQDAKPEASKDEKQPGSKQAEKKPTMLGAEPEKGKLPAAPDLSPNAQKTAAQKKQDAALTTAAVLKLSTDPSSARDVTKALKDSPAIRGALNTTPGVPEIEAAVSADVKSAGRDPSTDISSSWSSLGKLSRRYGLAEARRLWIESELVAASKKT